MPLWKGALEQADVRLIVQVLIFTNLGLMLQSELLGAYVL